MKKKLIVLFSFVLFFSCSAYAQNVNNKQMNKLSNFDKLPAKNGFQKIAINVIQYEFHPDIKPALIQALKQEFANCTIEDAKETLASGYMYIYIQPNDTNNATKRIETVSKKAILQLYPNFFDEE
jgi:hypothetical protein